MLTLLLLLSTFVFYCYQGQQCRLKVANTAYKEVPCKHLSPHSMLQVQYQCGNAEKNIIRREWENGELTHTHTHTRRKRCRILIAVPLMLDVKLLITLPNIYYPQVLSKLRRERERDHFAPP